MIHSDTRYLNHTIYSNENLCHYSVLRHLCEEKRTMTQIQFGQKRKRDGTKQNPFTSALLLRVGTKIAVPQN